MGPHGKLYKVVVETEIFSGTWREGMADTTLQGDVSFPEAVQTNFVRVAHWENPEAGHARFNT